MMINYFTELCPFFHSYETFRYTIERQNCIYYRPYFMQIDKFYHRIKISIRPHRRAYYRDLFPEYRLRAENVKFSCCPSIKNYSCTRIKSSYQLTETTSTRSIKHNIYPFFLNEHFFCPVGIMINVSGICSQRNRFGYFEI